MGGAAEPVYECTTCHMHYSAAQARRFHFKDPMDGGRLLLVKAAAPAASALTVHSALVSVGASDGAWTEVSSDSLSAGTQVVARGQAGLTDGARVVPTAWGADGPQMLPTAAVSRAGRTVYRCEKCGMTYSEADARKHGFVDPMDGGKLLPVKGQ